MHLEEILKKTSDNSYTRLLKSLEFVKVIENLNGSKSEASPEYVVKNWFKPVPIDQAFEIYSALTELGPGIIAFEVGGRGGGTGYIKIAVRPDPQDAMEYLYVNYPGDEKTLKKFTPKQSSKE